MTVTIFEYRVLCIVSLNINLTPKQLKEKYREMHNEMPMFFYWKISLMDIKGLLFKGSSHINSTDVGEGYKDMFERFYGDNDNYTRISKPWLYFT